MMMELMIANRMRKSPRDTAQDRGLLHLRNFNKISDFFEIVPKLCSKLTAIENLRYAHDAETAILEQQRHHLGF